jgi:1,4-alpha-glucan branching enzyme
MTLAGNRLVYLDHDGVLLLVRYFNRLYAAEPAFYANDCNPEGFGWINCNDGDSSTISFTRRDPLTGDVFVAVGNYTGVRRDGYRIGFPRPGLWKEVINTDSSYYGGSDAGNGGSIRTEEFAYDGQENSAAIVLPGLSTLIFKWAGD